ncbi:molybdenum cofactor synthesis protein [bacterium]|nr:molybdenum cofactor synthesis protein [bacterium]
MRIKVEGLYVSKESGVVKQPVDELIVDEFGALNDAHRGSWHRQISILSQESADRFNREQGTDFSYNLFAANMVVSGLDISKVALFDKIRINDLLLEITQIGKKPHAYNSPVYEKTGTNIMFTEGLFCRVLSPGDVEAGYIGEIISIPFTLSVITLSDRASQGVYEDLSGPAIEAALTSHFDATRFVVEIERQLLPDNREMLKRALLKDIEDKVYAVFTTGGTGIGPRDITPDVVIALANEYGGKAIPGVMEMIRVKYGATIPSALLSRSVAFLIGQTVIFTLPGSVKAVADYMTEILPLLEHAVMMVEGVGH